MPQLGAPELILILVIVILVFGVGKIGDVGAALGKGIREFRKATTDLDETIKDETKKSEPKKAGSEIKS
jgi:TatA/E family protein of Tat protein translocase